MAFGETIYVSAGGAVSAANVSGLSSRQAVFGSPTGQIAQDAGLQWDSTQKRLGINTSNMDSELHVAGSPGISTAIITVGSTQVGGFATLYGHSGTVGRITINQLGIASPIIELNYGDPFAKIVSYTAGQHALQVSGRLGLSTGTTGFPSLGPMASTNTGINWPTTARMEMLVAGTQVMSLTNNSWSIFTTTPQAQASSYTPSSTASGKVVLSTMSTAGTTNLTAWGFNSQAQILALVNGYNALSAVVSNLIADLKGFGFFA